MSPLTFKVPLYHYPLDVTTHSFKVPLYHYPLGVTTLPFRFHFTITPLKKLNSLIDVEQGFGQTTGPLFPIEGDTITIRCRANVINFFSPDIHIMHDNEHILLSDREGLTITHTM